MLKTAGVNAKLSRTSDIDDDLNLKIARCNTFAPDLAIDIHINAGGGRGFEAFHTINGGKGKQLAANIEAEIKQFTVSRGLKTRVGNSGSDYFGFIRMIDAPSIILEAAFIDNAEDFALINSSAGRAKFAKAYANGILKTLNIATTANKTANEETSKLIYNKIEEVPEFAKPTIAKLIKNGVLKGEANGNLALTNDMLRILVILDRAFIFDF